MFVVNSIVRSFLKKFRAKKFLAALSVLVVVAGMMLGARVAVADSVWVQSYQRGSASETCVAQAGETPWQVAWGADSAWKPSWEQWANAGKGGWTCTRSITWARTPVPAGSGGGGAVTYAVGDTGPGGGLVFLISGGKTYEMAPKAWGVNENTGIAWCDNTSSDVAGAVGTAVGTGSANTTAIDAACTSGAGQAASDYASGGFSDWFLPSQDELNAMCYYSRNLSASPDPTVSCYGGSGTSQNGTFAGGTFGFASGSYWSSSQNGTLGAWGQVFVSGYQGLDYKTIALRVRPIRAF